ncbi:MAG: DUF2812 domain-containing protein [Tissierellaceae bacterium]|nr:DUF2812 domain-containing protein [Tissierellaceae bacterium]
MNKTIKKFKIFLITDYEKEEKYLSQMSKKGYRLKKITFPGFYTFEDVDPEDIVYRLSFKNPRESDFNNYIQMFKDNGWEYAFDFMGWSYFRKSGDQKNTEIFSDDESRVEEVNKVFKSRFLPILIAFTSIVIPNAMNVFNGSFQNSATLFIIFVYALYVFLITYCGYGLFKLRKKYSVK